MTEKSYLWTTGSTGDGASTYTRADWTKIGKIFAACHGFEGVAPTWLSALVGSVPGANTARIAPGGGIVDGKPYDSDANVDVTIPSAVGGGNTRIDRIVLRCDWTGGGGLTAQQVRIYRIAGIDAPAPSPPAITQTPWTLYDITLYQALVDTGGAVTLTDERSMAGVSTGDIDVNAIVDTLLRDSAGLSVIGRTLNSSGDPADIVASVDGYVLRRSGATLQFGQVATAGISNDAVDDTKVGNRVPQFYRRQGGHATDWSNPGTTTYTPTMVRMQGGGIQWSGGAAANGVQTITFPTAFSATPLVFVIAIAGSGFIACMVQAVSSTQAIFVWRDTTGATHTIVNMMWVAIGPE